MLFELHVGGGKGYDFKDVEGGKLGFPSFAAQGDEVFPRLVFADLRVVEGIGDGFGQVVIALGFCFALFRAERAGFFCFVVGVGNFHSFFVRVTLAEFPSAHE